ncbi:MAG TPA: hypothetical protein VFK25_01245, partial [Candidatus Binatia bacterium]|nr:hypothetical protein [Candidatus Binatia bacterium]
ANDRHSAGYFGFISNDDCDGTAFDGLVYKLMSIRLRARDGEKHIAFGHSPGVIDQASYFLIKISIGLLELWQRQKIF